MWQCAPPSHLSPERQICSCDHTPYMYTNKRELPTVKLGADKMELVTNIMFGFLTPCNFNGTEMLQMYMVAHLWWLGVLYCDGYEGHYTHLWRHWCDAYT